MLGGSLLFSGLAGSLIGSNFLGSFALHLGVLGGSFVSCSLAGESLLLCFLCGSFALGLRLCFVFLAVRSLLGSSLVGFFLCTLVDRNQAVLAYP